MSRALSARRAPRTKRPRCSSRSSSIGAPALAPVRISSMAAKPSPPWTAASASPSTTSKKLPSPSSATALAQTFKPKPKACPPKMSFSGSSLRSKNPRYRSLPKCSSAAATSLSIDFLQHRLSIFSLAGRLGRQQLVLHASFGHHQRNQGRRQKQTPAVHQRQPFVTDGAEQAKHDGADRSSDAPNVVRKSRARRSQQGGKQRRQIHRE